MNIKIVAISVIVLSVAVIVVYTRTTRTDGGSRKPQVVNRIISSSTSQKKIVAFGDSLTAGYGVTLEESYPSILEGKLRSQNVDVQVINMGVSGETTEAALERLDFVYAQKPDIVLLGLGANDMLRSLSVTQAERNLEDMVQYFKERRVTVVLLGMQSTASNGTQYKTAFDALYPRLAKKYSLPLVPFFLEGVALRKELNTADGIHPNKDGYEKIVTENVLPVVLTVLGKKST